MGKTIERRLAQTEFADGMVVGDCGWFLGSERDAWRRSEDSPRPRLKPPDTSITARTHRGLIPKLLRAEAFLYGPPIPSRGWSSKRSGNKGLLGRSFGNKEETGTRSTRPPQAGFELFAPQGSIVIRHIANVIPVSSRTKFEFSSQPQNIMPREHQGYSS